MNTATILQSPSLLPDLARDFLERPASYERECIAHRLTEANLRAALAREEILLRQRAEFVAQQELLSRESDHRLLNDLQMIASLLSLQGRKSKNSDVAAQLAIAANRVSTIERVHRRLHCFDGTKTVAFRQFLEDFCGDVSAMLFCDGDGERGIDVEAADADLPTQTAIPLGFIVNELITNAAKYGKGRIAVCLESRPGAGYALSVGNDGPPLPSAFDPAASGGLGMKIVRSFADKIGGALHIERGSESQGPRFEIRFA